MTNWLATREQIKTAIGASGANLNAPIDRHIAAASADIERRLNKYFIPRTQARSFRACRGGRGYVLDLTQTDDNAPTDLLAVTLLTTNNGADTITSADYFLEPVNDSPYNRIEIDLGSATDVDSVFTYTDTPQRAISVTGRWGYSEDTEAAGATAEDMTASETDLDVTDASLIGVGNTLLIGTEQMFVTERAALDTTADTTGSHAADVAVVTIALAVGHGTRVKQGEVIQIDSEKMYVQSITSDNLTVIRSYDGTALASHATGTAVYAFRTLTVVRGVNGTTAATSTSGAAITKYAPPADVVRLCVAETILRLKGDESGQTGVVGAGDATSRVNLSPMNDLWRKAKANYRTPVTA